MKKPTAITLSALAVATLFLGCSAPAALTPTPAPPPADTPLRPAELPPPRPVASPATAERIGTWTFSPIRLPQLLATRATGPAGTGYHLHDQPEVRPGTSRARQMQSGNHALEYRFPAPPELGEGLIVAGVTAATLDAAPESKALVTGWLTPLRQAWAADAALVTTYSFQGPRFAPSEGYDPDATQTVVGILNAAGWPLAYVSREKREALYLYASGLVVRIRWQPPDLTGADVPVGAAEAVRRYAAAMRDPATRSLEERTGLDHFLGLPYAEAYPASTWDQWNNHDDDVPAFDFPADAPWEAQFLYEYAGKPVWLIGVPTGGGFGGGLVDAYSGELVRFHRVTRRWVLGPNLPAPSPFTPSPFSPTPFASAPPP